MRLIFGLAMLALAPIALAATTVADSGTQFLDKSIVTYPTSMGHYSLVSGSYDPANVANGVSLNYTLEDAPRNLQFNVYVYPLGRVPTTKAVTDATVEMEGEIRAMEQRKIYTDLKFDAAVDFEVAVPPSSIHKSDDKKDAASTDTQEDKASTASQDADSKAIVDALHESMPPKTTTGRKRALTLAAHGTPSESLAYVFYRNLFLISVRATVPSSDLPVDKFNALVDRAVQDLVPAMDIRNFGQCGTMYISVDEKSANKDKDALAGAIQIVREFARIETENCANKPGPDTAPPAGHGQQTIVYPAGMWK